MMITKKSILIRTFLFVNILACTLPAASQDHPEQETSFAGVTVRR
jgi:hypothetical protein